MAMAKAEKIQGFAETFLRIVNKFRALEKIPIDHGTGDLLYASEINTLEIIGKFSGINITQLAKKRGVTKGAASQIVSKLVAKKLVTKNPNLGNDKVLSLQLTKVGRVAFENHEKFHAKYDSPMLEKLNEMSNEQLAIVTETFAMLESTIDNYLKDLT
ncbi:MAG: MarR family transcriptional regulator [Desulfobulbaceae bacterium]|nr:MarR family transcriptional regulator [Desulfobulbaceae bacterium]